MSFAGVPRFDAHHAGLAAEKQHIVGAARHVGGDNQVTLDVLASGQPFRQNAIEAMAAQIPGLAAERMRAAVSGHVYRPLEAKPQTLAPFALWVDVLAAARDSDQKIGR